MDDPSAQLTQDLRASITHSLQTRRPLLHHLNADTSWLLQIPRPHSAVINNGRHWYNVLIDPWLSGSQSDVANWFSQQWHATESKVASIREVEELAAEIEVLTAGSGRGKGERRWSVGGQGDERGSLIDVVAISHEFTDHMHRETLLDIHKNVPVFATAKAAALIKSWRHFRNVVEIPPFTGSTDWRDVSLMPLPDWLGIARLTTKNDVLYYHSALMIVFRTEPRSRSSSAAPNTQNTPAEALIYTPHGIHAPDLAVLARANPPIQTLAFLHGLHDISLGQQLNLGAHNGLEAQRLLAAKYWIGTHDEVKRGGGLVSWFLRRKVISVREALEEESVKEGKWEGEGKGKSLEEVLEEIRFVDVGNGESVVLT